MDKTSVFVTETEAKALRNNRLEQWRLHAMKNNIHKSKLLRLRELNHDANKFRQRSATRLRRLSVGGCAPRQTSSEQVRYGDPVQAEGSRSEVLAKSSSCLLCKQIADLVAQYEREGGQTVSPDLSHDPHTTCFFKSDQEVEEFIESLKLSMDRKPKEGDAIEHAATGRESESATDVTPGVSPDSHATRVEEQIRALKLAQYDHDYVFGVRDKKRRHLRAQTAPARSQLESKVDRFLRRLAEFNQRNPVRTDFPCQAGERSPWHGKAQPSTHQPRTERKEAMIAEVLRSLGLEDKIEVSSYFPEVK